MIGEDKGNDWNKFNNNKVISYAIYDTVSKRFYTDFSGGFMNDEKGELIRDIKTNEPIDFTSFIFEELKSISSEGLIDYIEPMHFNSANAIFEYIEQFNRGGLVRLSKETLETLQHCDIVEITVLTNIETYTDKIGRFLDEIQFDK
jgi:hypothetical protein